VQHGAQQSPVAVRIETGPEALLLQVRNEGPPIDPGLLPSIFEPFRRGAARAPGSGSIGLGLFIVREIVRAHGGSVEVRSRAGEGTTFSVRLPRAG
jgi:signal transduction histidine kinase